MTWSYPPVSGATHSGQRSRRSRPRLSCRPGWPDKNNPTQNFDPAKASRLNPATPPDWRWRVKPLLDQRKDEERPAGIQLLKLDASVETKLSAQATMLEGFQAVAARHQHALERLRNARQILFRGNVGLVRFEREDQKITAVHEVYTSFSDPAATRRSLPEAFLVQVASLGPKPEDRPERLRERQSSRRRAA